MLIGRVGVGEVAIEPHPDGEAPGELLGDGYHEAQGSHVSSERDWIGHEEAPVEILRPDELACDLEGSEPGESDGDLENRRRARSG